MFTKDQIAARDRAHEQAIGELPLTPWDVVTGAPAFIRRRDLARLLAHFEIFKKVIDLPGCVIELGVFKGNSLFTWAKLMETYCPGDRARMVYGFDSFEGLQRFDAKDGGLSATHAGAYKAPEATVRKLVELHNQDGLLAGIP